MENLRQSDPLQDNVSSMLVNSLNNHKELSVMPGCLVENKKKILKDKATTYKKNTRSQKSSKTSGRESTLRGRGFLSSLILSQKEKSKQLWLPTKTDFVDSPSIYLSNYLKNTEHKSWFSMKLIAHHKKNSQKTLLPSSMFSPVGFTVSENIVKRSRKIRIYPNSEQKKTLKIWAGVARKSFNNTIELLKKPDTKANRFAIQKDLLSSLGETYGTPYKIKQMAIEDACQAVKNAKQKFLKTKQFQEVKFRSKKDRQDSLYIPKESISEKGVFKTLLGHIKHSEKLGEIKHDCKLTIEKNRFFVIVPETKPILTPENQRKKIVSLDPGARTFLTAYDTENAYKIGQGDFSRIYRMLLGLDQLLSKSKTNKRIYRRAIDNSLFRLHNLIDELHKQTASFLVKRYEEIVIPDFSATQMVNKLRSKTCRNLLSFAHSKFRNFLALKCEEYSTKLTVVSEEYTSKTCGNCGHVQEIGSKSTWECKECSHTMDRDINGARNILFLALGDTPADSEQVSALKCEI
jgi:putative transposase